MRRNGTSRKEYAFTTGTLGTATNTKTYSYDDATWGDLLTSINGSAVTYDAIGNPLTYGGATLTWVNGRRLASFSNSNNTIAYTYNDEGIRLSKTVNGVKHTYQLNGSQIVSETWGVHTIFYIYDETGAIAGMRYRTSSYSEGVFDEYLFEKNLQGDVVAIYNVSGTKLVSYTYDAWGKVTTTYHNGGISTGASYNPFLYRGYYYDSEIGLYYLNSRYYDPSTGRFISSDASAVISATPTALTDKNLFAYCDNNPIMRRDDGGEFWHVLVGAIIGGVISATISIASQVISKGKVSDWGKVATSFISGAATGALSAAGVPLGAMIGINATVSAAESVYNDVTNTEEKCSVGEVITNAVTSAGTSALMTYVCGSASSSPSGTQMNAMYKANLSATKKILAGGISPKAKASAVGSVKTYFNTLGKFLVNETRESFLSTTSTWGIQKTISGAIGHYMGW